MMSPDDRFEIGETGDDLHLVEEPLDSDNDDDDACGSDAKTVQARNAGKDNVSSFTNAFRYPNTCYDSDSEDNNNNNEDDIAEIEIVDETEGVLDNGKLKLTTRTTIAHDQNAQKRRLSDHLTSLLIAPVNKLLRAASPLHEHDNDDDYAYVTQTFGSSYQPTVRKAQYEPILGMDDDDDIQVKANNDNDTDDNTTDDGSQEGESQQQQQRRQPERVMLGYAANHGPWWLPPEIIDNWEHFVSNQPTGTARLSVPRPTISYEGFDLWNH